MLGSWFGQKGSDEGTIEGTTPRPSFGSPSDLQPPRPSADKPPKRTFPTAFSTPHDVILSELQGTSVQPPVVEASNGPPSFFRPEQVVSPDLSESIRDDASPPTHSEINLLGPTSNTTLLRTSRVSRNSTEVLLDPFDGMTLGVLIPHEDGMVNEEEMSPSPLNLPSSFDAGQTNSNNVDSEAVWSHLSRILDLQSQISKKHLEMENIGSGKANDMKKKSHRLSTKSTAETSNVASGSSSALGLDTLPPMPPGLQQPRRPRAMSTVSVESTDDEPEGNEEGVDVPSEEAEKIRKREDEFAKLATQFEGRKEAINDIMGKLDELSKALSEFHSIPSPNIDFSGSRQSSVGVTSPPITSPSQTSTKDANQIAPKLPQYTSPAPNVLEGATQHDAASSIFGQSPKSSHKQTQTIIMNPVPQKPRVQKSVIPTVLVNSKDPQTAFHESPASIGNLALPQE